MFDFGPQPTVPRVRGGEAFRQKGLRTRPCSRNRATCWEAEAGGVLGCPGSRQGPVRKAGEGRVAGMAAAEGEPPLACRPLTWSCRWERRAHQGCRLRTLPHKGPSLPPSALLVILFLGISNLGKSEMCKQFNLRSIRPSPIPGFSLYLPRSSHSEIGGSLQQAPWPPRDTTRVVGGSTLTSQLLSGRPGCHLQDAACVCPRVKSWPCFLSVERRRCSHGPVGVRGVM